eukprot:9503108-Pyramimonas_sp.AAC.2
MFIRRGRYGEHPTQSHPRRLCGGRHKGLADFRGSKRGLNPRQTNLSTKLTSSRFSVVPLGISYQLFWVVTGTTKRRGSRWVSERHVQGCAMT